MQAINRSPLNFVFPTLLLHIVYVNAVAYFSDARLSILISFYIPNSTVMHRRTQHFSTTTPLCLFQFTLIRVCLSMADCHKASLWLFWTDIPPSCSLVFVMGYPWLSFLPPNSHQILLIRQILILYPFASTTINWTNTLNHNIVITLSSMAHYDPYVRFDESFTDLFRYLEEPNCQVVGSHRMVYINYL